MREFTYSRVFPNSRIYTNPHEFGNSLKNVKFHIFVLRIYTQFCVFARAEISQAAWISACGNSHKLVQFPLFILRLYTNFCVFPHAEISPSVWISTCGNTPIPVNFHITIVYRYIVDMSYVKKTKKQNLLSQIHTPTVEAVRYNQRADYLPNSTTVVRGNALWSGRINRHQSIDLGP